MKLSEAMREGAKLRPQAFGELFQDNESGELCSCAIGAALEGLFGSQESVFEMNVAQAKEKIPALREKAQDPTIGGEFIRSIGITIVGLNDESDWSRERIADWLESIGY